MIVDKVEETWRVWKVPSAVTTLIHVYNQENGDSTDIVEVTMKVGQEKKSIHEVVEWFLNAVRSTK